MISFLLRHPSRFSWVLAEFCRPLPWRRRVANAWWTARFYNDEDRFRAMLDEWSKDWDRVHAEYVEYVEPEARP